MPMHRPAPPPPMPEGAQASTAAGPSTRATATADDICRALEQSAAENSINPVTLRSIISPGSAHIGCPIEDRGAYLEHVPPELNRQDSHGVLDRRFYRH